MGLDMWMFSVRPEHVVSNKGHTLTVSERASESKQVTELAYWRKHHDLHGWMEQLYNSKGGAEEFNCINLPLTSEDLDALESSIKNRELPETTGFFFGNNPPNDETDNEDLSAIEKAREALEHGEVVYYSSWW